MSTIQDTEGKWRNHDQLLDEEVRRNFIMAGIAFGLMFLVSMSFSVYALWYDTQGAGYWVAIMAATLVCSIYCNTVVAIDWLKHISLLRDELQAAYRDTDVATARAQAIQTDRELLASQLHDALVENDSSKTQANH